MNIKNIFKKTEVILSIAIIIFLVAIVILFVVIVSKKEEKKEEESKIEYVEQLENIMEKEKDEILSVTIKNEEPPEEPKVEEPVVEEPVVEEGPTPLDPMFNGYQIAGKITISKTGLDTPFFDRLTVDRMEQAPCLLLKTGEINVSGNTYIAGHNRRNGTLFSDNKYLEIDDKIIITAMDGTSREYTIYNKFETTAEDTSYLKRAIGEQPELTLQCCTDDDENRIIILARG